LGAWTIRSGREVSSPGYAGRYRCRYQPPESIGQKNKLLRLPGVVFDHVAIAKIAVARPLTRSQVPTGAAASSQMGSLADESCSHFANNWVLQFTRYFAARDVAP